MQVRDTFNEPLDLWLSPNHEGQRRYVRLDDLVAGRGWHSLTSQLNLSAFYGIGGKRRGCVGRVEGE